jgi:hypothetical protein
LAPEDATIDVFNLQGIQPFNQDLERQPPQIVKEFNDKIGTADAHFGRLTRIQLLNSGRFEERD